MPRYRPSIIVSVVLTAIVGFGCAGTGEFSEPVPQPDRKVVASVTQSASVEAVRPDEGSRPSMHDLQAKLRRLDLATVTVQQSIRRADDPAEVDALVMLLGLAQREKDSHRQQIVSYETQARGDQLYVSFQTLAPAQGEHLPPTQGLRFGGTRR